MAKNVSTSKEFSSVIITDQSILGELRTYESRYGESIAEFVWNAFDAEANIVDIKYRFSKTISNSNFGYPELSISDDGFGWDMSDHSLVASFLDSKKRLSKQSYQSLPRGSKGVGRFTFYSFARRADWHTNYENNHYLLSIQRENISNYELKQVTGGNQQQNGTTVSFEIDNEDLNQAFFENILPGVLLKKFAWFLMLYPCKKILINDVAIKPSDLIEDQSEEKISVSGHSVSFNLVRWKNKLADKENSKVYFIGGDKKEVFKAPSGLNNKSDVFYHSAYVSSDRFDGYSPSNEDTSDELESNASLFSQTDQSKFINEVRVQVRKQLEAFRQPFIEKKSEEFIDAWVANKLIPDPVSYRLDSNRYRKLIRETFVIAPNLYLGVSDDHKRVIFNLLASLMGTKNRELILKILEQVYDLSDEQKDALGSLLERTTIEGILDTIKEVDQRLKVIDDVDRLVHDKNLFKSTLEVQNLQRILNQEFWVFGEEYRLVIETEGSIRKAIKKWAKEILTIEDYNPVSNSRKEVDLLLSKKIEYSDRVMNIVVELKRPSIKLGGKEISQLKRYRTDLFEDPACTGKNIEWIFILVGRDYDNEVGRMIESALNHGEGHKGLIENVPTERTKIYVRKWSEIIEGELRPKHRYLSEKLQRQVGDSENNDNPGDITNHLLDNRKPLSKESGSKTIKLAPKS